MGRARNDKRPRIRHSVSTSQLALNKISAHDNTKIKWLQCFPSTLMCPCGNSNQHTASQTWECNEKWSNYWNTFHYRGQCYVIRHCFSIMLTLKDSTIPYGLGSTWFTENKCQSHQFYLMIVLIICFGRLPQVSLSMCVFLLATYWVAKYSSFFVLRLVLELG